MRKILPYIIATLTQHPRTLVEVGVDFQWSKKLWIHNIFRVYELIFGRRQGIKLEMISAVDEKGIQYQEFYTFESACAFTETYIRSLLGRVPRLKVIKVYLPVLAYAGTPLSKQQSPYLFAIALDATSSLSIATGSPRSYNHTCTGSNLLLWVTTYENAGVGAVSGVTYNSVSLSSGVYNTLNGVNDHLWYLAGPATDTHSVTITTTDGGMSTLGVSASYSGCSQTGIPDASASDGGTFATCTLTVNVVATGCWIIFTNINGLNTSAGTGLTERVNITRGWLGDSNGTVATGNVNVTENQDNGNCSFCAASFAPVVTSAIKTVNGLAIASVKTINELARASVKTWNGLA